jgi:lysyl-tRNA synthetase class 2
MSEPNDAERSIQHHGPDESRLPADTDEPDRWKPGCSIHALQVRAAMLDAVRACFRNRGYLEVETPLLSSDIVLDAHLNPFVVDTDSGKRFLQTSPEAGMKRLLAAGCGSIFQITRSFRSGEFGIMHNPEFTMIEWYGVGTTHEDQMDVTEDLVRSCLQAARDVHGQSGTFSLNSSRFNRIRYDDAFLRHAGRRVLGSSVDQLRELAVSLGVVPPGPTSVPGEAREDVDDLLNLILAVRVEPALGAAHPEFLTHYPASQAALARLSPDVPGTAERFELYIQGVEVCNGYHELTASGELQQRDSVQQKKRKEHHHPLLPGAPLMQSAMQSGLPDCAGVALGFDRLVMLALQEKSIAAVIPFPFDRA